MMGAKGNVDRFAPAQRPEGVWVALDLRGGGTAEGELLAVQDTALMVLDQDTVKLVLYSGVVGGRFADVGELVATPPAPDFAKQLSLVSRFPQGFTPDLLARLLAAYGQSALKVVAP
jgi:hypothetical protein